MSIIKLLRHKKFRHLITIAAIVFLVFAGKIILDAAYVPVIIMYHSVGEEGKIPAGYGAKLNVSPAAFEKQMKFLHKFNYNVIPLEELIERVKNRLPIPHGTIAITFDDGLKNNFLNAYPVLKKYDLPATIFVALDFVGRKNFLARDDIKAMQKNNISIGSHTVSHRWLPSLSEENITREIRDSKKMLEVLTGREIKILSYPLGAHNEVAKRIAREAGYLGAVSTNPGRRKPKDDIFALKRIRISMTSNNLITFFIETSGYYTFIKEIRDED
jgi:peptidoglycan/xylan/chitin deacetylase (PgdA/CDA1 family)